MFIRFSCFVNHIDSRVNLIEFYCSISFCNCCISFDVLNISISMSCTIASCHFLSILILSNLNRFSQLFRYSINFWAVKFSMVVNTICCFVRDSYIACINTSSFLCSYSASLILFRYSIELMFEIRFFSLTIMRLLNHAFDFARFAKSFFSCIFTLFVVFRDTTYVYKFNDDVIFDALWSLNCLRIKEIVEVAFEFFEF